MTRLAFPLALALARARLRARARGLPLAIAIPIAIAIGGPSAAAQEPSAIAGRVVDAQSGDPVAGAAIRVLGTVLTTFADDSGRFELRRVPPGARQLAVERIGYAPRTVELELRAGARATVEIALEPRAVALGGIVAAPAKRAARVGDAPVSVAVMEADEVMERAPATAADAIAYAPAVQFVGDQVDIRGASGFSRGTGSRVLLLIDGVPANAGDSGGLNWDVLPLTEIERIEVMKTAGSALYGTSALGGVINVVTAEPPADPITRMRLRVGFYDDPPHSEWIWSSQTRLYWAGAASHGRRLGPLSLWLRGGYGKDEGYEQNGDLDRANVALRLGLGDAGARNRLALFGSFAHEDHGEALTWCMRGQCDDPRGLAFQPARVPTDALDDRTCSDKARGYLTWTRDWGDRFTSFARASLAWNDWTTDFGSEWTGAETFVWGGEAKGDWRAASWLMLTLGGEAAYTDVNAELFGQHELTDLAGYLQAEVGLTSWLTLTAGLRSDVRTIDGGSLSDPWSEELSPRAGLVLAPDARTRVRASLGAGFRAPSAAEMFTETVVGGFRVVPNPELAPERSLAGELGIQRYVAPWLALDVAGFFYDFEDLIVGDTMLVGTGTIEIQFDNMPEARIIGLEAIARLSFLGDRLFGQASYTYLDTEEKATGEPLPYRPRHLLTGSGTLTLGGFEIGADYRFVSAFERVQVFTDERLDPRVDMRVLDARLAYRIGRQLIRFTVDNALNYGYTTVERNLEPIRRYTVALELEF
ncbi:MAG: TonB-dependent receptor [Gemmatimonadales bacterium]|jgi:iron complex outermembrane receptor protein